MYLKRLDIQGFKSFPEKLKLEFNKGITAVVGPNGSGKSNISDAVRWVLGEQSAKSLRGVKMEDVIFAGTDNRKPLGFAEVSITLDNVSRDLDIDFTEVTVTRRVYRSGESEYLLNGASCRLKDIYELFTDTGIGKEGYSIIGQGRIDEILSTRSEDRRNMFEEAAGILKFKNRREEARLKLDREHQNLERVEDIISTLEAQVEPLKLQSDKAKKYLQLKEQLKHIEINSFLIEADKLDTSIANVETNLSNSSSQLMSEKNDYDRLKQRQKAVKIRIENYETQLQQCQKEFYNVNSSIERKNNDIKLNQEQINSILKSIDRIEKDIEAKKSSIEQLNSNKSSYLVKYNSVELQLKELKEALNDKQQQFYKLNEVLSENENIIENYNSQIVNNIQQIANIKNSIQSIEAQYNQFSLRKEQISKEKNYNLSQINDKSIKIKSLDKLKNEKIDIENTLLKIIKDSTESKQEAETQLKDNKKMLDELNSSIAGLKSNYKYLEATQKEYRGFTESVKNILKAKQADTSKWKGVYGALGELISVNKEYETAIEIALGASINNVVTSNEQDAKAAIEYLKSTKGGRATFLPISSIKAKTFGNEIKNLFSEKGFLGIANDFITYDKIYDNIIKSLLGRVVVVDNLSNAITISKKYNYMYKIVTLDGDLISTGGALSGGSKAQNKINILGRARELKEIETELENLNQKLKQTKENIDLLEENINDYDELIEAKKSEYQENHISIMSLEQSSKQTLEVIKEVEVKQENLLQEDNKIDISLKEFDIKLEEYKSVLDKTETENKYIEAKVNEFQSNIHSDKATKENILDNITNMKVKISALEQEQIFCKQNIDKIDNDTKQYDEQISENFDEIKSLKNDMENKNCVIENIKEEIESYSLDKTEKEKQIEKIEQSKNNSSKELKNIEEEAEQKLNTISLLEKENIRIETQKNKLLETKATIYNDIWEEYELTYNLAKDYKDDSLSENQLQKQKKQLKQNIKELGNINIDSIEEYKQVKERFEFLTSQHNDIVEAEKKLQQIIEELTNSMTEQFTQQFKLISDNFSDVFAELFGGGKAYLKLSDTNNVLESGIDIIAQPPGKNLQNMMLLSGGERALTAIALLFAILKLKPSPFCILDEIEAALDDANVNRYADYLRKFSEVTQFIVVTHRKGTMEAADILYGVTMQEQGVSKLVSVKLEDNLSHTL